MEGLRAELVAALVDEYLRSLNRAGSAGLPAESHLRARALNRARLKLVADGIITRHLAAAFEIYGRG